MSCACDRRHVLRLLALGAGAPALSGCDRIASWLVAEEQVADLGRDAWDRLKQSRRASGNEETRAAARRVALRLLSAAGEDPRQWEIEVFADPTLNAFVLPGRKIGLFEGIFQVADSDGALAAVIGHEIGHLQAAHPAERITGELARQWGLQLVYLLLEISDVGFAREIAGLLGIGAEYGLVRPYGRSQEREADRLGVVLMARAGFDPREAVALWQRMGELEGARSPAFLSTHPSPASRARDIEAMLPELLEQARRSS